MSPNCCNDGDKKVLVLEKGDKTYRTSGDFYWTTPWELSAVVSFYCSGRNRMAWPTRTGRSPPSKPNQLQRGATSENGHLFSFSALRSLQIEMFLCGWVVSRNATTSLRAASFGQQRLPFGCSSAGVFSRGSLALSHSLAPLALSRQQQEETINTFNCSVQKGRANLPLQSAFLLVPSCWIF